MRIVATYMSIKRNRRRVRGTGAVTSGVNKLGRCGVSTGRRFTGRCVAHKVGTGTRCRKCPLDATLTEPLVTRGVVRITRGRKTATVTRNYANGKGSRFEFRTMVLTVSSLSVVTPVERVGLAEARRGTCTRSGNVRLDCSGVCDVSRGL